MATTSVALCTYNGAAYVAEQVRSILAQTRPVDEIVVGDDGSSDGTLGLVRAEVAGRSSPRLVVLDVPGRLGVTANFARTAEACEGDVVVFSDQDDVWHPRRVEAALAAFGADPEVALVFGDARLVDSAGAPLGTLLSQAVEISGPDLERIRSGRAFEVLLRRNLVTGATMSVRRDLIRRALPFPTEWVHDEWLAIIAAASGRLAWIPEPLVDYRQHGANEIGAAVPSLRYKIARTLERRGDRYDVLARRAEILAERLEADGAPEELRIAARAKAEHQRRRAVLPANRLARLPLIAAELRRGRYRAYAGRGALDALRDLLSAPAARDRKPD